MRHDQASRSDNNAHLMEGIVDASLINQLEGEMTTFREAIKNVVLRVEQLTASNAQESTALALPLNQHEQKRALYQKMIGIVLAEAGNEKLAKAW